MNAGAGRHAALTTALAQWRHCCGSAAGQATASLWVTLIPHGNKWGVYDIEPVSAGNN